MKELDKRMYYKAKPKILEAARFLRENMTESEKMLWGRLSNNQIRDLRFRRQHPIDIFIADFYCHKAGLVIEIDGEIHTHQREYDDGREAEIERYNLKVIRFSNDEVMNDLESVVGTIESVVKTRI